MIVLLLVGSAAPWMTAPDLRPVTDALAAQLEVDAAQLSIGVDDLFDAPSVPALSPWGIAALTAAFVGVGAIMLRGSPGRSRR